MIHVCIYMITHVYINGILAQLINTYHTFQIWMFDVELFIMCTKRGRELLQFQCLWLALCSFRCTWDNRDWIPVGQGILAQKQRRTWKTQGHETAQRHNAAGMSQVTSATSAAKWAMRTREKSGLLLSFEPVPGQVLEHALPPSRSLNHLEPSWTHVKYVSVQTHADSCRLMQAPQKCSSHRPLYTLSVQLVTGIPSSFADRKGFKARLGRRVESQRESPKAPLSAPSSQADSDCCWDPQKRRDSCDFERNQT